MSGGPDLPKCDIAGPPAAPPPTTARLSLPRGGEGQQRSRVNASGSRWAQREGELLYPLAASQSREKAAEARCLLRPVRLGLKPIRIVDY